MWGIENEIKEEIMISAGFNVSDCGSGDADHIVACQEAFQNRDEACESIKDPNDPMAFETCMSDDAILNPDDSFKELMATKSIQGPNLILMKEAVENGTWATLPLGAAEEAEEPEAPEETAEAAPADFTADIARICEGVEEAEDCSEPLAAVAEAAMAKHNDAEKVKKEYIQTSQSYEQDDVYADSGITVTQYIEIVNAQGKAEEEEEDDSSGKMAINDGYMAVKISGGGQMIKLKNKAAELEDVPSSEQPRPSALSPGVLSAALEWKILGTFNGGEAMNDFQLSLGVGYTFQQGQNFKRTTYSVDVKDTHSMDFYLAGEYAFIDWMSVSLQAGVNIMIQTPVMAGPFGAIDQNIANFKGKAGLNFALLRTEHVVLALNLSGFVVAGGTLNKTKTEEDISTQPQDVNTKVLGGGGEAGLTLSLW